MDFDSSRYFHERALERRLRIWTTNERFIDTPLIRSLTKKRSDEFILVLLNSGCNVNVPDEFNTQPLELAMERPSLAVAHELIQRGANINVLNVCKRTPLQAAISTGNLEAVCMLLQYGADVNITDRYNRTPLINSLILRHHNITETLINYYDDFSCTSIFRETALDYAIWSKSRFAIDMVKAGADVNYCLDKYSVPITFSLDYDTDELFKLIWRKLDHQILLNKHLPFLTTYLSDCKFPSGEWFDCLLLVLACPVAYQLIDECEKSGAPFIAKLLRSMHKQGLRLEDRVMIINLVLSLGATAKSADVQVAMNFSKHQLNSEVEALIYGLTMPVNYANLEALSPMSVLALAVEEDADSVLDHCKNLVQWSTKADVVDDAIKTFRYFSVPAVVKKELIALYQRRTGEESPFDFARIPQLPSLMELSRNRVRKFLKSAHNVEKPYQFHDAVKNLNVPREVKDVIRFRRPLY